MRHLIAIGDDCRQLLTERGMGFRQEELAKNLNITQSTVNKRIAKCLKKLNESSGGILMKREDFDEDDIQGMLIAYLDEQMEPDERNEFEKPDAHEDLRADLELYRKTSVNIGNLFELESAKTPAHILADFHQRDLGSPGKVMSSAFYLERK